ncbi:Os07g0450225 [Oryza sativa Japonica Group]|uniref:Os07g0450225 protein n=1 Tax=Oryza sativa subsp. japonica TaxID=39947 RepID=C7J4I6_ORYSJ|nr:Os07g0450225 [Oryza sativa Japonica Group]|eukprot:NP_001175178.1 Os07g0450225 [Oryza sativa Japonica Group]
MLTSQPASVVAFSPYLPSTLCHFVIVEPAVPLPSLGATVLRHLPVEPTATVVFSWSQWSALPPTISSTAISSLLVAAACRLLHTSPIVTNVYQQGSKLPQVFQVILSEEKNTFIRGNTICNYEHKLYSNYFSNCLISLG